MLIFKTIDGLQRHLKGVSGSIGFVPTMGALHEGHLSLIAASRKQNAVTVCSIFVNPLQFNNSTDLEKYPRTLPKDIEILLKADCDVLFAPEKEEMDPEGKKDEPLDFDPGALDTLFEGALRPGHFKGVAVVVHKLFRIVNPHHAYFGLKDYQQCMLIHKLVDDLNMPVSLHFEPTLRESDGLAMSSRNMRLREEERRKAVLIYETLQQAKQQYRTENITTIEERCKSRLSEEPMNRVEYFNIVHADSLLPLDSKDEPAIALCAVYVGGVRLIDNLRLN